MKNRLAALALVALVVAGCSSLAENLPHAKVDVGFMGADISIDTRPFSDPVAGAVVDATDAVGLTTPPAAAPAK